MRLAYEQRVSQVFTEVAPPPAAGYHGGMAVRVGALEQALLGRFALEEDGPLPAELTLAGVPGLAEVVIQLEWERLVLQIGPSSNGSPSSLDVLAAVPGSIQASAGLLAVQQEIRITARLAVELGARVPDGGGLELMGSPDPDSARLAVVLPGFPPGLASAVSSTAEVEFRRLLRAARADSAGEGHVLIALPADGAFGSLSLSGASVRTFPAGRDTLFIGFHTTLPVTAPSTVSALHLDPGDQDWVLRIDEQPLALLLARTGLSGKLGAGLLRPSQQLDVESLALDANGFVAHIRLWQLGPPMSSITVDVSGAMSWHDGQFVLGIHTMEMDGRTEVGKRHLPWILELAVPDLPVTIDRLNTLDGALEVRGRL